MNCRKGSGNLVSRVGGYSEPRVPKEAAISGRHEPPAAQAKILLHGAHGVVATLEFVELPSRVRIPLGTPENVKPRQWRGFGYGVSYLAAGLCIPAHGSFLAAHRQ